VVFDIDGRKAVRLLRKACAAGIREAMYDLAICYEKGFGVSKSQTKAFNLYLDSALHGDLDAREEVIRCVYWGLGIEKNRKLAHFIRELSDHLAQERKVSLSRSP
jgi:TPR repeat protein